MARKRIAIFCDGTWNSRETTHSTNVLDLYKLVLPVTPEGVEQVAIYEPGVGAGIGLVGPGRLLDKIGGGAFGWGLFRNIKKAYRQLVECYETGDEIFIFGFSRGAYTARSLAGLIRSAGILPRENIGDLDKAFDRYRSKADETRPKTVESWRWRLAHAPDVVTEEKERQWRIRLDHPAGEMVNIAYVGIWDTVGSLGIPERFGLASKVSRSRYQFHDTCLSSLVRSARHAQAIDETRPDFKNTPWERSKLDQLNKPFIADGKAPAYLQHWFPGEHGSVGGGGEIKGLSNDALVWVAEGAEAAGLVFDATELDRCRGGCDPLAPLRNTSQRPGFLAGLHRRPNRFRALARNRSTTLRSRRL